MAARRSALRDLGLVAAGAIPGALLRWRLADLATANLLGCLLLGLLLARPAPRRLLWGGVGFCGSLTSFSGWMLELQALPPGSAAFLRALLLPLIGGAAALLAGRAIGAAAARALRR